MLNGYDFSLQRAPPQKPSQWICCKRPCKARLHVQPNEREFELKGDHDHLPNFGEVKAAEARAGVKRRAVEEPYVPPALITQQIVGRADSETLVHLGGKKEGNLKRTIQRARQKNLPPSPTSLVDLDEIPQEFSNIEGKPWLLYDSGNDGGNRVMLFGLEDTVKAMSRSSFWFGDGTFKTSPRILTQVYSIHYQLHDHVVLGVIALMEHKDAASYLKLFRAIKNLLPERRNQGPQYFSLDFEDAAMNTFTTVFEHATVQGCFFHWSQILWRRAQASEVATAYLDEANVELRSHFHCILGLAFLPLEDVPAGLEKLRGVVDERLDDVIDHVEKNYVLGRIRGRGRTAPRYPPRVWNCHIRTLQGLPRTNNSVEGWHRRLKTVIGKEHPSLYVLLSALMEEEKYAEAVRTTVENGSSPKPKKKRYQDSDRRLHRLVVRYVEGDSDEEDDEDDQWEQRQLKFLRRVGHSARSVYDQM